jgi:hypothetical protein
MTTIETRLTRVETEVRFRHWLQVARRMDTMSLDELERFAATGQWPDKPDPALGTSRFDSMDRESLIKLWIEDIETFAGRSSDELEFYAVHGHWPEQSEDRFRRLVNQPSCAVPPQSSNLIIKTVRPIRT